MINEQPMAKGEKFDNVRLDTSRNGQTFIYTFSAKLPLSIGDNYCCKPFRRLASSARYSACLLRLVWVTKPRPNKAWV